MGDAISLEGRWNSSTGVGGSHPSQCRWTNLHHWLQGIGHVLGDNLVVEIQPWLAGKLRVSDGSYVVVDNRNGKFTITRSARNDRPTHTPRFTSSDVSVLCQSPNNRLQRTVMNKVPRYEGQRAAAEPGR
jgi:hypothetical protein